MNRHPARSRGGFSGQGGRSWRPPRHSDQRHSPAGAGRYFVNDSSCSNDGTSHGMEKNSPKSPVSGPRHPQNSPEFVDKPTKPLSDGKDEFPHKDIKVDAGTIQTKQSSGVKTESSAELHSDFSCKVTISSCHDKFKLSSNIGIQDMSSQQKSSTNTAVVGHFGQSEHPVEVDAFDICQARTGTPFVLKPSLLVKNKEKRNEMKRTMDGENGSVLRSGMVLLKNFLSLSDQVKIVKVCQELGLGSGGFYQPGYRDGAKLHLKMMCLGKNWDPETSMYGDHRPIDGAKPPPIHQEFHQFVEKAIKAAHSIIQKNAKTPNVEDVLPWMSPTICIVNFYSASGRLGLHQDRDESSESLSKGLPVVSFSCGDSAEFLYGDQRDVDKADKLSESREDRERVRSHAGEAGHMLSNQNKVSERLACALALLLGPSSSTRLKAGHTKQLHHTEFAALGRSISCWRAKNLLRER